MIRKYQENDFDQVLAVINDAAVCYKGLIPQECFADPYMSREYLKKEMAKGVKFWIYESGGKVIGVMGIQDVNDVTLIRHAYVRAALRQQGIGSKLLTYLRKLSAHQLLVGTWQKAVWAVDFYKKNGFEMIEDDQEKNDLLKKYWNVTTVHRENSVVLKQTVNY